MHLVEAGLIERVRKEIKSKDATKENILWWYGYIMGLLEGGLLTQEEHDRLSAWLNLVLG